MVSPAKIGMHRTRWIAGADERRDTAAVRPRPAKRGEGGKRGPRLDCGAADAGSPLSLTLSPLSRGEGKQFEWSDRSDQYSAAHLIEVHGDVRGDSSGLNDPHEINGAAAGRGRPPKAAGRGVGAATKWGPSPLPSPRCRGARANSCSDSDAALNTALLRQRRSAGCHRRGTINFEGILQVIG